MSDTVRKAIPNALSFLRILLGLVFPWLPASWRLPCVGLAALTDVADGEASRLFKAESTFGRMLDPIADKVFLLAVVGTLIADGLLTVGEVVLIALRDLAVVAGCLWIALRAGWQGWVALRPRWLGKLTTGLQIGVLLVVLLDLSAVRSQVLLLTAILSGLAAVDYLVAYFTREGR